ncbi:hypothetical protein K431DRAFT_345816 [Polychaeton citri CBS 116435]|uniref:GPI ethanolamine phosphate transferase 3 n=1 Tax=Polychaeton citri CBS 116435 TaxID=1314669 RepID=A0A9P4Q7K2_9PEZI|nr:hypothetical protein K431DRAFT_345816 [Polychaeton citri CBS 116435]
MSNNGGGEKELTKEELKVENKKEEVQFKAQHGLVVAFFCLVILFHVFGLYLFCSGFLLSRLVLNDKSQCAVPPAVLDNNVHTPGSFDTGCWHPKSFDKAVVIVIDALRYDFTVPFQPQYENEPPHHFHDALPILYETATKEPQNAFLRPFIADPPTTTLQRLKGLTTGTLPTFIDAGSNFAGTTIDEDNLVQQLSDAGKKVVHLGDDTWHSLFPGLFEPNLTKAYDSFNVWDLHTVDDGVNEHLFPLLESKETQGKWDIIFGHYLGVDHAGHRYGPDHSAMTDKLKQMNDVLGRLIEILDDQTLLVVLGDHGMDIKGDHGGESDDEVEAALWMYSKKGIFGRSNKAFIQPPKDAKERPVGQIDLVPTLAFLLGLPVPFNNLGRPIEEAFIGAKGSDYANLARVARLTSSQIHRYQGEYARARGLQESDVSPTFALWDTASQLWARVKAAGSRPSQTLLQESYEAFSAYQAQNLLICRALWARFDLTSMYMGIVSLALTFVNLIAYARGLQTNREAATPIMFGWGLAGTILGGGAGMLIAPILDNPKMQLAAFGATVLGNAGVSLGFLPARDVLKFPRPSSLWGWLCFLIPTLVSIGFGSNSFTIFEDEQLLFLLTTFGTLMLALSLGRENPDDRWVGATNSMSFIVSTRLASFARLCREEQMPFCMSTYYASATSSTSAAWQLVLPFASALLLPIAIKHFYMRTRNYQGSAVIWIGIALRIGLVFVALFWAMDAADDGEWYPTISKAKLKFWRSIIAQVVLAVAFAAGYATFILASPFLAVKTEGASEPSSKPAPSSAMTSKPINEDLDAPILTTINAAPAPPKQPRSKLIIYGYANTHGSRYFLLPCIWLLALLLVQKPTGQGTLALCIISILNLLEILDALDLQRAASPSPLGPVVLALLGHFYFFKTGHQAVLASIQWETAFIALQTVKYPWSPLLVILNTFGANILCAIAVPAVVMWKIPPKAPGLLGRIAGAMATHIVVYAAIVLATVVEAAWLRRHLMLYRVFMPRMLLAVTVGLVVEVVGVLVAVVGARWSVLSVGDIFGWI